MKIIWRIFSRHSASQHPVLCPFRMICPVWNCYYICLRRSISGEYLWKYAPACNNSNNINIDLESTGRVTRFHRVANIIIIFLCVWVLLWCLVDIILLCKRAELHFLGVCDLMNVIKTYCVARAGLLGWGDWNEALSGSVSFGERR